MKPNPPDWYRHAWSLDVKQQSWVEQTEEQVDFLVRQLSLCGGERILDLACGFGRHALALARRGFSVVGVDLTPAYIEDAQAAARAEGLDASFSCMDIRDVRFSDAFDAVLSMADGAVGYLETDEENEKIFDIVARALKPGGRHFLDVCSGEHAAKFFPKKWWEPGDTALSLSQFEWNPQTKRMLFGGWEYRYGQPAEKPRIETGDPIRLYTPAELSDLYAARGMRIENTFSTYGGKPADDRELQLLVIARKQP